MINYNKAIIANLSSLSKASADNADGINPSELSHHPGKTSYQPFDCIVRSQNLITCAFISNAKAFRPHNPCIWLFRNGGLWNTRYQSMGKLFNSHSFLVRYTVDDGATWTTVGLDVSGGELTLAQDGLPKGAGRFQIILADQSD